MRVRAISVLTRKELRDALRNRWFLLYAVSLSLLALALSAAALLGSGQYGFANFGRTAASLINLVLLVVPLMALMAGAQSLVGERERGTLAYLLAQPVSRAEVFCGKFLGLAAALCGALVGGFGLSALVMLWQGGDGQVAALLSLMGLSVLLCLASLSIGMLLSCLSRTSAAALGAAVFVWLLLAFGGDLGVMGAAVSGRVPIGTLFGMCLINPLSVFRMASVLLLRSSLEILGPAGLYAVRTYGALLLPLFAATLLAWTLLPAVGALRAFYGKDAA